MPIVKGSRSGKAMDMKVTSYGLPMSASMITSTSGINLGGMPTIVGDDSYGVRNYVFGMSKETSEGSPNSPCIRLEFPSFWRFRWVVKPGQRQIAVRVKQAKTFPDQRPKLVVKANANVGLTSDLEAVAPEGTDWVVLGPIIFTATGTDMVYVEVHNRLQISFTPMFFDHIVAT
jgi:hypothetical protein